MKSSYIFLLSYYTYIPVTQCWQTDLTFLLSSATASTIRLDFVIDQNVNKYQKMSHIVSMKTSVSVEYATAYIERGNPLDFQRARLPSPKVASLMTCGWVGGFHSVHWYL